MTISFLAVLKIIGALGLFIFGIKTVSEGVQKAFSSFLKEMINIMTKNHFLGILAGFIIAVLAFSSSATTVMAVSFVNIGLISLAESVSVMLGANIGTTVVSWLVAAFDFNGNSSIVYSILFALGTPLIFSGKSKLKYVGEVFFGLALLFLGIFELIENLPIINNENLLFSSILPQASFGLFTNLFFVCIGVFLTLILQSSIASIVFTQVLCYNGIISFEMAIPLVLGQNFGRTINTEIAAVSGNVFAKRSARIHSLINTFGLLLMLIVLSVFDISNAINNIVLSVFNADMTLSSLSTPIGIALFHSGYNILNASIIVWFIPQMVRLATNTIKSKGDIDEEFKLEHIGTGIMNTPEMSMIEAQKEIVEFGKLTKRMHEFTQQLLTEQEPKKVDTLLTKIKKYEAVTDKVEQDVANYLTKIAEAEMNEKTSIQLRGMLSIISDLERIGDIYYQISKVLERKFEEKIWFTPEQRNNISSLLMLIDEALEIMNSNLKSTYSNVAKNAAVEAEHKINQFRKKLRKEHYANMEKGEYSFKNATIYSDLFNSLEKVGDHIINVTEGVIGEI